MNSSGKDLRCLLLATAVECNGDERAINNVPKLVRADASSKPMSIKFFLHDLFQISSREEMPGCSSKSQSDSGTAAGPSGPALSASEDKGNLGKRMTSSLI